MRNYSKGLRFLRLFLPLVALLLTTQCEEPLDFRSIELTPLGNGSVNFSQNEFELGAEVTIEATADPGYSFVEWIGTYRGKENPP